MFRYNTRFAIFCLFIALNLMVRAQTVEHQSVEVKPLAQRIQSQVVRYALIGTKEHVVRIEKIYSGLAGSKDLAQVFDAATGAELFKGQVEIPEGGGDTQILLHLPRPDGTWIIYTSLVKKEYHLYAAKMVVPQLAFVEQRLLLKLPVVYGFTTACWQRAAFLISASADGGKVAVYFDRFKKKDKMQPAVVAVFNASFELEWAKDVLLDDPQAGVAHNMCVSRSGKVALLRRAGILDPSTYSLKSTLRLVEIAPNSVRTAVITPLGADGIVKQTALEYDGSDVIHLAGIGTATSKKKDPSGRLFVTTYSESLAPSSEMNERVNLSFDDLTSVRFSVSEDGEYCAATGHDGNTILLRSGPGGEKVSSRVSNAIPMILRPNATGFDLVLAERGPGWSWKAPQVNLCGSLDNNGDFQEFGRFIESSGLSTRSDGYRESTLSWNLQGMLFSEVCYDSPKSLDWIRISR